MSSMLQGLSRPPEWRRGHRGFTLIEVMVVVVIIAIIAAIALPNYRNHVRKVKRVECEGVMMNAAAALERRKSATMSYKYEAPTGSPAAGGHFVNGAATLSCPQEGGGEKSYTVNLDVPTPTTFTMEATPLGDQLKDKCGKLTLNSSGSKGSVGLPVEQCW